MYPFDFQSQCRRIPRSLKQPDGGNSGSAGPKTSLGIRSLNSTDCNYRYAYRGAHRSQGFCTLRSPEWPFGRCIENRPEECIVDAGCFRLPCFFKTMAGRPNKEIRGKLLSAE